MLSSKFAFLTSFIKEFTINRGQALKDRSAVKAAEVIMMNKLTRLIFYLTCVLMVMPLLQGTVYFSSIFSKKGIITINYGESSILFKASSSLMPLENIVLKHDDYPPIASHTKYSYCSLSYFWITTKLGGSFKLSLHKGREIAWVRCVDLDASKNRMGSTLWRYEYPLGSVMQVSIFITEEGLVELYDKNNETCLAKLKEGFFKRLL